MDKPLSVQRKRTTKQAKTKKKPVKVVYISNPMKVNTSPSEFRALVQELTGQDADMLDPARFSDIDSVGVQEIPNAMAAVDTVHEDPRKDPCGELDNKSDLLFETCDDVFIPQMMENFPGLFPSNLWYESAHVDVLKSLDAV